MARGDRPHSIKRRLPGAIRARGTALCFAAFVLVPLALLLSLLPTQPAAAQETQWVLTQTLINPEKVPLEYYGGGKTPGFFGEERFKDMFLIYEVSSTSFTVKDHWQDWEYVAWDVTITCDFDAPESTLTPGKSYKLTASFSHSGTAIEPTPGARFAYEAPEVGLQNSDTLAYYPWTADFNGVDTKTWTFTAPAASPGATMQIQAGLWNAAACTVVWKYEARSVASGTTTTTTANTSTMPVTSESAPTTTTGLTDSMPPTLTDEEYEKGVAVVAARTPDWAWDRMKQGYVGIIIVAKGDCRVYDYTGLRVDEATRRIILDTGREVMLVRIGDTLKTTANGRMLIELIDWDRDPRRGPSIVHVARNSTMVFNSGWWTDENATLDLIRGCIRALLGGWERAGFSVRAGVTTCGIRGSDVLIVYNPENDAVVPPGEEGPVELLGAYVLEGHMDVASETTGKLVTLTDKQTLVTIDGNIGEVGTFTQQNWDEWIGAWGLEEMEPLSTGEREALLAQTDTTPRSNGTSVTSNGAAEHGAVQAGTDSSSGKGLSGGILALIIVLAVLAVVAVGVGVYLLRKRRQTGGSSSYPDTTVVAPPSFCRACGSATTPGSTFCSRCGQKL
ncbi:MAG: hypothetical protein JW990_15300 [Thermoleophilia bacterium]|nr:hypothetical protein [Thermoleophilia bacterium]